MKMQNKKKASSKRYRKIADSGIPKCVKPLEGLRKAEAREKKTKRALQSAIKQIGDLRTVLIEREALLDKITEELAVANEKVSNLSRIANAANIERTTC